jgi:hypothetical protein
MFFLNNKQKTAAAIIAICIIFLLYTFIGARYTVLPHEKQMHEALLSGDTTQVDNIFGAYCRKDNTTKVSTVDSLEHYFNVANGAHGGKYYRLQCWAVCKAGDILKGNGLTDAANECYRNGLAAIQKVNDQKMLASVLTKTRKPAISNSILLTPEKQEMLTLKTEYFDYFNYSDFEKHTDYMILGYKTTINILVWLAVFVAFAFGVNLFYSLKKREELTHEKLLRAEGEERNKRSQKQIEENEIKLAALQTLLSKALDKNDSDEANKLQLDTELLTAENAAIKASQRRQDRLQKDFISSALYQRIKLNAGKENFKLSEEEWERLEYLIDLTYDKFTQRLMTLVDLSETERHICYLVKMKVQSSDIAQMLNKSKGAITMARQRMFRKIKRIKGTAKQFDEYIASF